MPDVHDELVGKLTPEQEILFKKLTKLQKGLALHYLDGKKPAEAHRLAGGKCKNEKSRKDLAAQILANHSVRAFVDSVEKKVAEEVQTSKIMSRQEALERLSLMGRAKLSDVLEIATVTLTDDEGKKYQESKVAFKGLDNLNELGDISLSEIKINQKTGEITIKQHDQKAAIKQVSEMLGYNREADDETSELTQEERVLNMVQVHAVTDEKLD